MKIISVLLTLQFLFAGTQTHDKVHEPIDLDAIKKVVIKLAEKRNIPTLSLIINTSNDSLKLSYHHPKVEAQTMYGVGSSSKLIVSVLIFHLAEQGKIDLNDNIYSYLDQELTNHIEGLEQITVKNLLNHTSGLSDYTKNPAWIKSVINNNSPLAFKEKIALVDSSLSSSGSFTYSNTNYLFLEQIVEYITGESYSNALKQFYHDQGLSNIKINHEDQTLPAYFATDKKASSDVSQWIENYGYDGGIYSTANELNRFLKKLFIVEDILSESSLSKMQEWIPMMPMEIPIGEGKIFEYGYGLMKLEYNGKNYIGHSGGTLKYQSFLFYDQNSDITISLLTNSSGRYYNNAFFQELIPAILARL